MSFTITTPIYYVNDSPHIGHAYTTIAADVMARFKRLSGEEVFFLTGTDEHGQKVDKAAKLADVDPQSFTDNVSQRFRDLVSSGKNLLNISNDDFIRTTETRHKIAAQALWQRMVERGFVYLDRYAGWYSVRDEAYYQESELIDGKAPTGADVEWTEEESYFFKLSAFQEKLLQHYAVHPDFILPKSRYNEVVSFVKGGLKDLSISRTTFEWGIEVPSHESTSAGNQKHVMYVWIDALCNYITACGFPDMESEQFKKFWINAAPIHLVGKDILRFHAVYWPAFLMAADISLPKQIVAHGWWTIEGQKMSKSLGNVVAPDDLINNYGLDATRYFLMREIPFGNDGNFSRERIVQIVNSELSNTIGNLAQRSLSFIAKNCGGIVPDPNKLLPQDEKLMHQLEHLSIAKKMQEFDYSGAIERILHFANKANEYIDSEAPWKLKANDPERMNTVLYTLAEALRCIGLLLQPFIPESAAKLLDQLAIPVEMRQLSHLEATYRLKAGTPLPTPIGIFPRLEHK